MPTLVDKTTERGEKKRTGAVKGVRPTTTAYTGRSGVGMLDMQAGCPHACLYYLSNYRAPRPRSGGQGK